jgi:hypothetical protein
MDRSNKELITAMKMQIGCLKLFPELDSFTFKSEALAARMYVFEHEDEF